MTEAEWLACTDPQKMLEFLRGRASDRKLRLFAAACCRRIWLLLTDERSRRAVEIAERYADGQASDAEVDAAYEAAFAVFKAAKDCDSYYGVTNSTKQAASFAAAWTLHPAPDDDFPWFVAWSAADGRRLTPTGSGITEHDAQHHLLRDLFRPVTLDPAWLTWHGGTVPALAQAIYDDRHLPSGHLDHHRLAILADALEDAGCTDQDILVHCRGPGPHVRGCWVIDSLLGKT
jgi:hypothetical protein